MMGKGWIQAVGICASVAALALSAGCTGEESEAETLTPPGYIAVGAPDLTFAALGYVLIDASFGGDDFGYSVGITNNNSIVAAGCSVTAGDPNMAMWRFTSTGVPDISFSGDGSFTSDVPNGGADYQCALGMAMRPNGGIQVAGEFSNGTNLKFVTWRMLGNGSGFDTAGFSAPTGYAMPTIPSSVGDDSAAAVAIDSAGDVVLAGYTSQSGTGWDLAVAKRTSAGAAATFGTAGAFKWNNASGNLSDYATAVAITSTDDILVVGGSDDGSGIRPAVWKIMADGSGFVAAFNSGAPYLYVESASAYGVFNAVTLDSAGNIYAAGRVYTGTDNAALVVKFKSNGALDTGFGTNGVVKLESIAGTAGNDEFNAITRDSKGNLVLAGIGNGPAGEAINIAVMRLKPNGAKDTSFGTNGAITLNGAGGNTNEFVRGITMDQNGRIVVVGYGVNISADFDLLIARFK